MNGEYDSIKQLFVFFVEGAVYEGAILVTRTIFSIHSDATSKILGALALLIPTVPTRMKEFAYFGFTITLISAIIAHSSSGDGISSIDPLVFLGILIVSYLYFNKIKNTKHLSYIRSAAGADVGPRAASSIHG